jgi:hypothetical protein
LLFLKRSSLRNGYKYLVHRGVAAEFARVQGETAAAGVSFNPERL